MISPAQQNLINAQLAGTQLSQQVSNSVAAKVLDTQRNAGQAAVQMLDAVAKMNVDAAGDALVAKATGLGSLLDITA